MGGKRAIHWRGDKPEVDAMDTAAHYSPFASKNAQKWMEKAKHKRSKWKSPQRTSDETSIRFELESGWISTGTAADNNNKTIHIARTIQAWNLQNQIKYKHTDWLTDDGEDTEWWQQDSKF